MKSLIVLMTFFTLGAHADELSGLEQALWDRAETVRVAKEKCGNAADVTVTRLDSKRTEYKFNLYRVKPMVGREMSCVLTITQDRGGIYADGIVEYQENLETLRF